MTERRQGVDELNQRLTRLETIATSELDEPGEGDDWVELLQGDIKQPQA